MSPGSSSQTLAQNPEAVGVQRECDDFDAYWAECGTTLLSGVVSYTAADVFRYSKNAAQHAWLMRAAKERVSESLIALNVANMATLDAAIAAASTRSAETK